MKIKNIELVNFRNYKNLKIEPSNFNIVIGKNAQGKSNLIESIYYLGNGISFRTNQNKDLINWNQNFFKVEANCKNINGSFNIKSIFNINERSIMIDDIRVKKLSDVFKKLSVCIFEPDDLYLIKGNPAKRRNFLDREIITIYPLYYDILKKFNNVNYQRNILLKYAQRDNSLKYQISDWTEIYLKLAFQIVQRRIKFIDMLKPFLSLYLSRITQEKETIDIKYDINLLGEKNIDFDEYKQKLYSLENDEIQKGNSIFGPHRDDFNVYINNFDVKKYGSQGQQRTVSLCLKLAYLEIAKKELGEYPILLLDDVMSELDIDRRIILTDTIHDKIQTFITTTDLDVIKGINKENTIFNIHQGNLI